MFAVNAFISAVNVGHVNTGVYGGLTRPCWPLEELQSAEFEARGLCSASAVEVCPVSVREGTKCRTAPLNSESLLFSV